jgi:hypothetical protein
MNNFIEPVPAEPSPFIRLFYGNRLSLAKILARSDFNDLRRVRNPANLL